MGRQLNRVPLDFHWTLHQPWEGYLNDQRYPARDCQHCDGGCSPKAKVFQDQWYGYVDFDPEEYGVKPHSDDPEHREVIERKILWSIECSKHDDKNSKKENNYYIMQGRAALPRIVKENPYEFKEIKYSFEELLESAVDVELKRMLEIWNNQWSHNLNQDDIDVLVKIGDINLKDDGNPPTPEEVNLNYLSGLGPSSYRLLEGRCEREGVDVFCKYCNGESVIWESEEAKEEYENWEPKSLPEGEGYQLWETVSEGSPVTPVFKTSEELAQYLVDNDTSVTKGTTFEQWMAFIEGPGWAPSLMGPAGDVKPGVQAVADMEEDKDEN